MSMEHNGRRTTLITAGFLVLLLIACGIVIKTFFPDLLHLGAVYQAQAEKELFAMDTYITLSAYGDNAEAALEEAAGRITELERLWSVTDAQSDIYAVNHSDGQSTVVSEETVKLVSFALQMAEETDGALEPTIYPVLAAWGFTTEENQVPSSDEILQLLKVVGYDRVELAGNAVLLQPGMMLDFGAVAKGYAGDIIIEMLKAQGITSALINVGGNVQTIGTKPDGSAWRLGLRDPFSGGTLGALEIADLAVVTSGNYERYFTGEDGTVYGHIMDPATGYPVQSGLSSVTIIADEGKLADALSTALFVKGLDQAIAYWRQHRDFDMILITDSGEIYLTEDVSDDFSLESGHGDMKINVIH